MSLLPVEEALRRILGSVREPLPAEPVPLAAALGRTLAEPLAALRTQPPFRASAMDGYALRQADAGGALIVVGESVAGRGYGGALGPGEAVRIFTGAPVPDGADAILIQENASRDGDRLLALEPPQAGRFIRPAGLDFTQGDALLEAGARLGPARLALAAAMGHPRVPVRRKPRVGVLATGDELVRPGEPAGPDQIVASNLYAVAALCERAGAEPIDLGIAADDRTALRTRVDAALARPVDCLVTLGGASVGEHDLVREILTDAGMDLGFWRIAMRPGKPLLHGRIGRTVVLGLPGNPVSSIVCAVLFLTPLLRALQGDPDAGADQSEPAILAGDLAANDSRQDYLRAELLAGREGLPAARAFPAQDSSMLRRLAEADALIVRAPHAPAARAGDPCRVIRL